MWRLQQRPYTRRRCAFPTRICGNCAPYLKLQRHAGQGRRNIPSQFPTRNSTSEPLAYLSNVKVSEHVFRRYRYSILMVAGRIVSLKRTAPKGLFRRYSMFLKKNCKSRSRNKHAHADPMIRLITMSNPPRLGGLRAPIDPALCPSRRRG